MSQQYAAIARKRLRTQRLAEVNFPSDETIAIESLPAEETPVLDVSSEAVAVESLPAEETPVLDVSNEAVAVESLTAEETPVLDDVFNEAVAVAVELLPAEETPVLDESLQANDVLSDDGREETGSAVTDTMETSGSMDQEESSSINRSAAEILSQFSDEWIDILDKDDKKSLAMFLCHNLSLHFNLSYTKAAEMAAEMIKKSDRTVRQWRSDLVNNDGIMPCTKQGKYIRTGVLWQNEELNKKASDYVRANQNIKGKPNMTVTEFCKWINNDLLPNSTLEPGYPRNISLETARRWLHQLGFQFITPRKGIFVDGHERDDVVEYRSIFLRRMCKIGFLHPSNAPTADSKSSIPTDIEPPSIEQCSKTVVICHDESTFCSNEDQSFMWGTKDQKMIKPKSKGSGIMVSDFIDEFGGFLALSSTEYETAKLLNPRISNPYAREFLEYGENKEGYWTRDKFIAQMKKALVIAEFKYPKSSGWRHVWIFDHSSCHSAMADDSLDVNHMNVKPGGKQRIMHDTAYNGRIQKMYITIRGEKVAKGMKNVLEERGVSTTGRNGDWMRHELASHPDFKHEKCMIEKFLISNGHICVFLPKYHPELNPIERVWAQLKRHVKAHCKYTFPSLRKNIPLAYDSVSLENIQNHFRKVRHYMYGYMEGLKPGAELDEAIKRYKVAVKSHRRISMNN